VTRTFADGRYFLSGEEGFVEPTLAPITIEKNRR
jgi:hypothetical protein